MSMKLSREKAAQAWCHETTKHKQMDVELAEQFAVILESIWSKPWLGNATTKELLEEIECRIGSKGLQYRTVDERDADL
ncbi:MAG: hypothetical protein PHQ91_12350 [Thermoanaerobaculaceae bacterium]|nr:hypothetical protein [Thermoanaerobaculaceae bacterium]